MLAWKIMAQYHSCDWSDMAVQFQDVQFVRATILPRVTGPDSWVKFIGRYDVQSGLFDIKEGGSLVSTGKVFPLHRSPGNKPCSLEYQHLLQDPRFQFKEDDIILDTKDFYKELRVRGYDYGPSFQATVRATADGRRSDVEWTRHWVSFVDCILHLCIIKEKRRDLFLPTRVELLRCDPDILFNAIPTNPGEIPEASLTSRLFPTQKPASDPSKQHNHHQVLNSKDYNETCLLSVIYDRQCDIVVTVGIELKGLKKSFTSRQRFPTPTVESLHFIPFDDAQAIEPKDPQLLDKYIALCDSIITSFRPIDNHSLAIISTMIKEFEEKYMGIDFTLMRLIWNALERFTLNDQTSDLGSAIQASYEQYKDTLNKDFLQSTANDQRILRPSLDIVLEQWIACKRLSILELMATNENTTQTVEHYIQCTDVEIILDYSLAHPDPGAIDEYKNSGHQIHQWHIDKSIIPSDLTNSHLIIIKISSLSSLIEIARQKLNLDALLESACAGLRDEGFLLMVMRCTLTQSERIIYDALVEGKAHSTIRNLKGTFDKAITYAQRSLSLVVTSRSVTTHGIHSLLLRKRQLLDKSDHYESQISMLCIQNDDKYSWLDRLKHECKRRSDGLSADNLWLVANNNEINGLFGLMKVRSHMSIDIDSS